MILLLFDNYIEFWCRMSPLCLFR